MDFNLSTFNQKEVNNLKKAFFRCQNTEKIEYKTPCVWPITDGYDLVRDIGWCIVGPPSDKNSMVETAQIETFDGIEIDIKRLIIRNCDHRFKSFPDNTCYSILIN